MNKIKYKYCISFLKLILGILLGLFFGYILRLNRIKDDTNNNAINSKKLININDYNLIDNNKIKYKSDLNYDEPSSLPVDYIEDSVLTSTTQTFSEPIPLPKNKHIFVGVMTTKDFLLTRARAAYDTWVKTIPGKVIFFSSENSEASAKQANLPEKSVVSLRGVDDVYPPQKKSFLLLKYMHDVYLNDYEWFLRADDDTYVKGEELSTFLRSVNSSGTWFIGQSGQGNKVRI